MIHEDLETLRKRFNAINESKEPVRTNRLSQIITDMEQTYNIPNFYSAAYSFNNPEVMSLYREIQNARFFKEVR